MPTLQEQVDELKAEVFVLKIIAAFLISKSRPDRAGLELASEQIKYKMKGLLEEALAAGGQLAAADVTLREAIYGRHVEAIIRYALRFSGVE